MAGLQKPDLSQTENSPGNYHLQIMRKESFGYSTIQHKTSNKHSLHCHSWSHEPWRSVDKTLSAAADTALGADGAETKPAVEGGME